MRSTSLLLIDADTGNSRHVFLGRVARRTGNLLARELAGLKAAGEAILARRTVALPGQRWVLVFTTAYPRCRPS